MHKMLMLLCAVSLTACSNVSPPKQIKAEVLKTCPKPPAHPPIKTLPKAGFYSESAANAMRQWLK